MIFFDFATPVTPICVKFNNFDELNINNSVKDHHKNVSRANKLKVLFKNDPLRMGKNWDTLINDIAAIFCTSGEFKQKTSDKFQSTNKERDLIAQKYQSLFEFLRSIF